MKIVVVVPTYNERPNIAPLVERTRAACARLPHVVALLVVDDGSPDGTADAVRRLQRDASDVHLLEGRKAGLGDAYLRGIGHAVEHLDADVVVQMDADLSHRPEDIPRLVAALEEGAEFAIGSRYVDGCRVPHDWPLLRRLNSHWGNLVARRLAKLGAINDCTAGFRAIRTPLVREMRLERLRVTGFALMVAMLHEAHLLGARIREIPVEYVARTHGKSKLRVFDVAEFIFHAFTIRLNRAPMQHRRKRVCKDGRGFNPARTSQR